MSSTLPAAVAAALKQAKNVHIPAPIVRNGSGSFVFPCRKLVLNYCETSGSSAGFKDFLIARSQKLAHANPAIELIVQPRPSRHPIVRAFYANGRQRVYCVKNKTPDEINTVIERLLGFAGNYNQLWKKPVISNNPSVRGIWSPFNSHSFTCADFLSLQNLQYHDPTGGDFSPTHS
ncbi:54S ribosomal protein L51, mitochondrial [Smittium mucronatum]|uniref:Large ribosomal subunit protein mL43 n=1 Tax=Smittium mucronatum TaxID=133383 RepID=A0A1R0H1I2_9FUNG|nr:54S ribosomal protein L51, mitochondrial [Smittium mucronatum]